MCGEDDGDYVRLREIPGVGAVVAIPKGDPSDDTASEDNKVIEIHAKTEEVKNIFNQKVKQGHAKYREGRSLLAIPQATGK